MNEEPGDLREGADENELKALVDQAVAEALRNNERTGTDRESRRSTTDANNEGRPLVFMVMPFGNEDMNELYENFVEPALSKNGYACVRGDDIFGSQVIVDDVVSQIQNARVIVADLSGHNPNVCYEVGYAHALEKPVLLMSQSIEDIPFDLRHRRILPYSTSPRGCKDVEANIVAHVSEMTSAGR